MSTDDTNTNSGPPSPGQREPGSTEANGASGANGSEDDRKLLATAGTQARRASFGPGGGIGMPAQQIPQPGEFLRIALLAEHVQCGVRAHQLVTAIPLDAARDHLADHREGEPTRQLDGVPDVVTLLAHPDHVEAGEHTGVVRLATTGRVERGAVERDRPLADIGHGGIELHEVGVAEVQQLSAHAPILPARMPAAPAGLRNGRRGTRTKVRW